LVSGFSDVLQETQSLPLLLIFVERENEAVKCFEAQPYTVKDWRFFEIDEIKAQGFLSGRIDSFLLASFS
jgi:hypothetical protein